jgi:predicted DNA-binding protein with PD1-like motif
VPSMASPLAEIKAMHSAPTAANTVQQNGKSSLHAHVVAGKSNGTVHRAILLRARVWPTLEMIVPEMPVHLRLSP